MITKKKKRIKTRLVFVTVFFFSQPRFVKSIDHVKNVRGKRKENQKKKTQDLNRYSPQCPLLPPNASDKDEDKNVQKKIIIINPKLTPH